MGNNNNNGVYSQRLRAGKRRTYFFDVRTTKSEDYYITITESKKKYDQEGYERHKIFLYKEDFNKFLTALENTIDHVKDELMPDYDFDEFDRDLETYDAENNNYSANNTFEKKTAVEDTIVPKKPEFETEDDIVFDPTIPEIDYSDSEEDLRL